MANPVSPNTPQYGSFGYQTGTSPQMPMQPAGQPYKPLQMFQPKAVSNAKKQVSPVG